MGIEIILMMIGLGTLIIERIFAYALHISRSSCMGKEMYQVVHDENHPIK